MKRILSALVIFASTALGVYLNTLLSEKESAVPVVLGPQTVPGKASPESLAPSDDCQDLYERICKIQGESHDPTGYVRPDFEAERRTALLVEQLTSENPDWESEEITMELANRIYTPGRAKQLRGAFAWARRSIENYIERQPPEIFSRREKHALIERIQKVKLEIPPPALIYADEPDLYTKDGVFYERLADRSLRLRVGGAYLFTATSWFNRVFTFAHELAHAIDPCELRAHGHSLPAYDRLAACFQDSRVIANRRGRMECGENDQLSEAFADWMAAQVTGEALIRFATEFDRAQILAALGNSVRDLCDQGEASFEPDDTFHPDPRTRIAAIFGKNPLIRRLTGCDRAPASIPTDTSSPYCSFTWSAPPKSAGSSSEGDSHP